MCLFFNIYPITIFPLRVNLMALATKFVITWCNLFLSVTIWHSGKSFSTDNSTPAGNLKDITHAISLHTEEISTSSFSKSSSPASIWEISIISDSKRKSISLFSRIIWTYSFRSPSFSASTNRSENPTIAFKGVLISWFILAKKALVMSNSFLWLFFFLSIHSSNVIIHYYT